MTIGSEYYRPSGSRGTRLWNVTTRDMRELKIFGELIFTPRGSALVYCDCGTPHLLLGLARGQWGTVGAVDETK